MPWPMAASGPGIATASPRISSRPPSGRCSPAATFIRVDLPAPFSPITTWISPFRNSTETPLRAWIPWKCFEMSTIERKLSMASSACAESGRRGTLERPGPLRH